MERNHRYRPRPPAPSVPSVFIPEPSVFVDIFDGLRHFSGVEGVYEVSILRRDGQRVLIDIGESGDIGGTRLPGHERRVDWLMRWAMLGSAGIIQVCVRATPWWIGGDEARRSYRKQLEHYLWHAYTSAGHQLCSRRP